MEQNIKDAVKLYSGDKPLGMFVCKLDKNIEGMNAVFTQIKNLFEAADVANFEKLPGSIEERKKFAKLFREFNSYLESAKVQGFIWECPEYNIIDEETGEVITVSPLMDYRTYRILVLRYKELSSPSSDNPPSGEDLPYDLAGYITTIDTDDIDADYMNSRFDKYRKALSVGDPADVEKASQELHNTFASLTQEEQKFANIFLRDIETGDVVVEPGKSLRDYINEYMTRAKDDQIHRFAETFGLDEDMLRKMMSVKVDETNINEFGRFDNLIKTANIEKAKAYFGESLPLYRVKIKLNQVLREFILNGGYEISKP